MKKISMEHRKKIKSLFVGMKSRCYNSKSKCFEKYGSKDIKICDEWLEDFEKFYTWAINNNYKHGLQIDRINTFGNYSPDNCRFVTAEENNRNTKASKWWFVNGQKYESAEDAAKSYSVNKSTIHRWCEGYEDYKNSKKYSYPPKENCWTIQKYINGRKNKLA